MTQCNRCGVEFDDKDLAECEGCHELVCEECCVGVLPPPHPMIDFNLCKDCYEGGNDE